jgi:Kef-type K+ transport system membrane component KefB
MGLASSDVNLPLSRHEEATGPSWLGVAGYAALIVGGVALFFAIRSVGEGLTAPAASSQTNLTSRASGGSIDVVAHVVATLAAILAVGFVLGRLLRYLGQPAVVGEMAAGIVLGPSLLGALSPEAFHLLIPSGATDPHGQVPAALKAIAQLGVILYMFLVGLELNAARIAGRAHAAVAVSHASIVAPFVLGTGLALWLYPRFAHQGVSFTSFALFMGVAMAITAFPVLARILGDRGLDKTELGGLALGCAAADDVTAWCLLALVVGVAQSEPGVALWVIGGAVAFISVMLLAIRPLLRRWVSAWDSRTEPLPSYAIPGIFLAVLLASLCTESIGIHAVFGAFLVGAVLPHDSRIAREMTSKLKEPVTILFLPAFFAYTGMRTEIRLVEGWEGWLWCCAIILVATAGKFGGTFAAARLTGFSARDAAALGMLMNTRGLMELIVLNIGLDLGVISPTLFAMMVVMALATTAATSPALHWLLPARATDPGDIQPADGIASNASV